MINPLVLLIIAGVVAIILLKLFKHSKEKAGQPAPVIEFTDEWRAILNKNVPFYVKLEEDDKRIFEHRVLRFLSTKVIEGVKTDVDDLVRLLVACSAIIPTFAFPHYNYPGIRTVLIYPNSFNEEMATQSDKEGDLAVTGMLDNRSQNGSTIIFSKSALIAAFRGVEDKNNVGIHEFVHLLDMADGEVDGVPEALLEKQYVGPWLKEIKNAARKIERGKSDINPYALTNNAEFLAVVSEYFFDNPDKFVRKHPELYEHLSRIFNTDEEPEQVEDTARVG